MGGALEQVVHEGGSTLDGAPTGSGAADLLGDAGGLLNGLGAGDGRESTILTINSVVDDYLIVLMVSFLVTLLVTPIVRRLALQAGIVDLPDQGRKAHREPVAYLGGVAVFAGLIAGIITSYLAAWRDPALATVPMNIIIAMAIIMFSGLLDDIFHWDPNLKIGMQFAAAAVLALDEQIGGRVAAGLLHPIEVFARSSLHWSDFNLAAVDVLPGAMTFEINIVYWTGAVIIGLFVLGGCNAANLLDGLDGLLTGSIAIMAASLLIITLVVAALFPHMAGDLTGTRVILCFALLGVALGFLPHNFRPASIFLGDAGSLLLGFTVIVIILLLGETGYTHLVFAGLIVFGLPILDTTLAIIRRRLHRMPIWSADDNHLHHMLKRTRLGTVGAVFMLYGVSVVFSGVALLLVLLRARVVYALVVILAGFIVVIGVKAARRRQQTSGAGAPAARHLRTGRAHPTHSAPRTAATTTPAAARAASAADLTPSKPN